MVAEKKRKTKSVNLDQSPEIFVLKQGKLGCKYNRREFIASMGNSVGVSIPGDAVCVCNCVASSDFDCVGYGLCEYDGHTTCNCVEHGFGRASYYWHIN